VEALEESDMVNSKGILVILALVIASIFLAGCTQTPTGRVLFAVSDAAADMGSVIGVSITVDSVEVQNDANQWVTVSSSPKTYDLLALKATGVQALLADVQLKEGTYNQVRLIISKVVVTDANGTHDAKLPSNELKIVGRLVVDANSTSTAVFDFVADESLHMTGDGQYILAPVVRLETRNRANASVESDKSVRIEGGNVVSSDKYGMDANGEFGKGHMIPANADLTIESDGKVKSHIGGN
jgi:hypothetical protein